jgi:hypothetical protein
LAILAFLWSGFGHLWDAHVEGESVGGVVRALLLGYNLDGFLEFIPLQTA